MNIAQVFQRIERCDFDIDRDAILCLIYDEIRPSHPGEVDICFYAMKLLPRDVLLQANHKFCKELHMIHCCCIVSPMREWLTNGLNNGYERRVSYTYIFDTMRWMQRRQERYIHLSLTNAMQQAYTDWRLYIASDIPDLWTTVGIPFLQSLERAVAEQDANVSKEKEDPIVAYCKANSCTKVDLILPSGKKESYFLTDGKLSLSLPADSQENDIACAVCMQKKASLRCGNDKCIFEMCELCFHKWFSKKEECPGCRQNYIPLAVRG